MTTEITDPAIQASIFVIYAIIVLATIMTVVHFGLTGRIRTVVSRWLSSRDELPSGYTPPEEESDPDTPKGKNNMSRKVPRPSIGGNKLKLVVIIIGIIFIVAITTQAVVIVEPGHRGVLITLGSVEPVVLNEGFHFITPFTQHVYQSDVRTQRYEASSSAATKDLQEVSTTVTVQYRLDPSRANIVYQTLGENYAEKIIAPAVQESVKAATARFDAENLITQRALAKQQIDETFRSTLVGRDVVVEQILITDFQFSQAFKTQIDAKAVAYQTYLTEQNKLLAAQVIANQTVVKAQADAQANIAIAQGQVRVAELQAQAKIAQATGDSEAIRLINEELRNSPDYLQLQAIQRWNGAMPYYVGSGGGTIFSIPLNPPPQDPV